MDYNQVLRIIADENNTTPQEVETEIKKAIKAAGYDMSPQTFISLCVAKVKKTINSN